MFSSHPYKLAFLIVVLALVACDGHGKTAVSQSDDTRRSLNSGYVILHTMLRDQQYLKTIRLTKTLVTFQSVSEPTRKIVDAIAQTSSTALDELERLASEAPKIDLDAGKDTGIEQMTRDALRTTTAKEYLTSKKDFELVLLISQIQVLRYITHLAMELKVIETNDSRRAWLDTLSGRIEKLYLRVLSRLKVA